MRWTKNGTELFDGGSLDLHQYAEVCVLHIMNVKRSDAAEYELQLSNDSGTVTVPITVKVIGKSNRLLKSIELVIVKLGLWSTVIYGALCYVDTVTVPN